MASLMVNASSKNSSRSGSPSRATSISQLHQQQSTGSLDHTPRLRNVPISQAGEGSTGSGSSGGGGGGTGTGSGLSMKNSSRQRSPGTVIRMGDAMDEPSSNPNTAEPDEFVPNIHPPTDDEGEQYHTTPSFLSNGSSELIADDVDSSATRVRQAIEHIQSKIAKTRELIRIEQTTRDENVNEYLKLAANADKQQLTRIKTVFEKKNQKSAHSIAQLQKKLDSYTKKLKNYEMNGAPTSHRQPREMLRDMGQGLKNVGGNIRDGITGFSGSVMSKPREFAHLIKNKFGSADNINTLSLESNGSTFYVNDTPRAGNGDNTSVEDDKTHHGSATLPGGCSLGSTHSAAAMKFPSEEGSECSSVTSESGPGSRGQPHTCHSNNAALSLKSIFSELQEHRENLDRMREKLDTVKALQQEVTYLSHSLQEERFRCERLEEQINDLTELHQNEVENLKQTITDMEEKVQYQSEDRLRDIHEMLESCQTKICKMEHQQQQHQQYVTLEGLDNSNARALVVKLINVVLTVLQVILLLVATGAGIMMPFLRTSCTKPHCFMCRVRILTTTFVVLGIVFVLKQWPEVHDVGSHLIRHLKQTLAMK
ncbi:transmembrane and coiled-coil domains protein 2 isoform X2 [Harpegnathos saltator]|uniref:transmembrane and coiled-coil domains protein 2 isoform X2 n=1 Tax=Harpegnathos saltator TaxID=610380 RepID=UPI000DBED463|nr:transmembrane and coiled-coil domains protein 2 isoform X2 [Harpegnathos saltator]